jgi:hypothetical protein
MGWFSSSFKYRHSQRNQEINMLFRQRHCFKVKNKLVPTSTCYIRVSLYCVAAVSFFSFDFVNVLDWCFVCLTDVLLLEPLLDEKKIFLVVFIFPNVTKEDCWISLVTCLDALSHSIKQFHRDVVLSFLQVIRVKLRQKGKKQIEINSNYEIKRRREPRRGNDCIKVPFFEVNYVLRQNYSRQSLWIPN